MTGEGNECLSRPRLNRNERLIRCLFVTEHGPPPPHPNQPPHKREISPSGDRPRGSLIPGNHGRLLKNPITPNFAKLSHAPRFSTSRLILRSDPTYLLSRVFLAPAYHYTQCQPSSTAHHHRRSPRMVSSTGSLLQLKCPRGNKKLISPRYLGTKRKQLPTYNPCKNERFSAGVGKRIGDVRPGKDALGH